MCRCWGKWLTYALDRVMCALLLNIYVLYEHTLGGKVFIRFFQCQAFKSEHIVGKRVYYQFL